MRQLKPFRNITCPTSVSRHDNTLKGGKIHRYNDLREIAKTPICQISSSSVNKPIWYKCLPSFLHTNSLIFPCGVSLPNGIFVAAFLHEYFLNIMHGWFHVTARSKRGGAHSWITTACISRHDNTLKGGKIHRYNDIREIAKTPIWGYACYYCHPLPLPSCCSLFLMPSSLVLPAYTAFCSCSF